MDDGSNFLNNYSKVTGVQDIINRMRNLTEKNMTTTSTATTATESATTTASNSSNGNESSESKEDQHARMLLNNFLGAQVLMSTVEPFVKTTRSNGTDRNGRHDS